jgi:lipid A ethanolaminephosphotransferase
MTDLNQVLSIKLTPTRVILLVPVLLLLTGNWTFFSRVENVYPWAEGNAGFLVSLAFFHYSLLVLLMVIFSLFLSTRIAASVFILLTAMVGYFSDQLGIMIDTDMIGTMFETNISEAADLLNAGFVWHMLLLGVAPVILMWLLPFRTSSALRELRFKAQTAAAVIAVLVLSILPLGDHYASFFREHKPLRNYMHPTASILYMGQYIKQAIKASEPHVFATLPGKLAPHEVDTHSELVIMVVGETARADHFSLNGYARKTNPRLEQEENIISYTNISSCGTLTAVSVPCMFAYDGHDNFDRSASYYIENVLDLLKRSGVNILWRDNNSDSKGVADRVAYENFQTPEQNHDCDTECRDTGMLEGLQEYIDNREGDILIVLHSMGSHGPAYFKRYPKEFETFTPACNTLELSQCSNEEIINAYDNTIAYTDYFLSKVIELLKRNTPKYETAMFYVSDHGESLGESGIYLHGMPYMIAPDAQVKVPIITWAGQSSDIDIEKSAALKDVENSHDAVFETLLTFFEIQSDLDASSASPLVYLKDEFDAH